MTDNVWGPTSRFCTYDKFLPVADCFSTEQRAFMNLITDAELGQIELQRADRERRDRGVTSCTAVAVTDRVSG